MHMSSYKIISLHYLMTLYTCFIWLRIGQYEITENIVTKAFGE